jgi:hypothetical protein
VLEGEGRLLKLISRGAPLTHVLDALCASLNLQVGNVVSLVLFSDDEEHCRHTIEQYAAQYGLFVFCCTTILSPSEELLGTFEVYCCFPQIPTLSEIKLIERATEIAALAIQRHNQEQDSESFPFHWKRAMGSGFREEPPSKN